MYNFNVYEPLRKILTKRLTVYPKELLTNSQSN